MIAIRKIAALAFGMAVTISAEAAAQECLGITAGSRGYASYGVEGTDGVTGQAATVGLRLSDFNVQLHARVMDPGGRTFSSGVNGRMHTVELQVARPITKKLPLCLFSGLGWTGYDLEHFSAGETSSGGYTQLRVPLGISLGKEFKLTENLGVSTFVQNAALYQFERFDPSDVRASSQSTLGIGMTAGLGLTYGRLMLRSTISNYKTLSSPVGLYNDFPYMSLQVGVKF